MAMKLRELIREVRQCKSASAERSVIAKELAAIRTAIKIKDKLEYRHRNVAKLMYCDMLGYPTHFGQMEVLKLLASKPFVEKRLGYLALMQLLDENTEVLMLSTQSLKQDMAHENPFIVGLALCAMGNIASTDISRDLARELEKLLKHSNPYIRKKALCTAIRVINRVPEMCDEYFKCAVQTLEDTSQTHGPTVASVQLLYAICKKKNKNCKKLRKYSTHIIQRLSSLLRSSYDPDHDIGGVTDPFLQVHLLKLLRLISTGDKKLSDDVDSTLAQIATNTESNKNPGNSILYECVRTIMSIEKQSSLHVLAINILGRFLVNRDNNVRYVALNALCNAVTSNVDAIQRHRNTIVECLKDADLTIRKRALDLIYALTNKKNVKSLVRDLLNFLTISNTTNSSSIFNDDKSRGKSAKNDDNDQSQSKNKRSSKYNKKGKRNKRRRDVTPPKPVVSTPPNRHIPLNNDGQPIFISASSLSSGELEFRRELASKICLVVERYAPSKKWHIDTVIQVMATTTSTGFKREQEVISSLFVLITNTSSLQSYCTYKLFDVINKLQINSDPIRQISSWLIGEYGDKLMNDIDCREANDVLLREQKNNDANDDNNLANQIENITMNNINSFNLKSEDEVIAMIKYIIKHNKSTSTTIGYGLTALMKLRHKFQIKTIDKDAKIIEIIKQFKNNKKIEVQQRSCEFFALFNNTDQNARNQILKPMPVPDITKLFRSKNDDEKKMHDDDTSSESTDIDDDDNSDDNNSSDDNSDNSSDDDNSDDDSDDDNSTDDDDDDSSSSDDDNNNRRKKNKKKNKNKKKPQKKNKKPDKKLKKNKKNKSKNKIIPILASAPGDQPDPIMLNNNNISSNGGTSSHINGGGSGKQKKALKPVKQQQQPINLLGDMMFTQPQQPPQQPQQSSNNPMDTLEDILGLGISSSSSQPSQQQQVSSNPLQDIMGVGSGSSSISPTSSSSSPQSSSSLSKKQPFEAYNRNGITATFNFVSSNNVASGICRVLAVFHNSNSDEISNFSFMIAVPKYLKLQIKPANGVKLLALSQNSITQKFQLTNTMFNKKPFMIRMQLQWNKNGINQSDRQQIQFPNYCC